MTAPIKLIVNLDDPQSTVPDIFAKRVEQTLQQSGWSEDLTVSVYEPEPSATDQLNAARRVAYDELTETQKNLVTDVRSLLHNRIEDPSSSEYRQGLTEMLAMQIYGDVEEADRAARLINPLPIVDDVTLTTLGHLVVEALRNIPPTNQFSIGRAVQSAARDLNIVFEI